MERVAKILSLFFFCGGKCFRLVLKEHEVEDNRKYSLHGRLAGVRFEKSIWTRAAAVDALLWFLFFPHRTEL